MARKCYSFLSQFILSCILCVLGRHADLCSFFFFCKREKMFNTRTIALYHNTNRRLYNVSKKKSFLQKLLCMKKRRETIRQLYPRSAAAWAILVEREVASHTYKIYRLHCHKANEVIFTTYIYLRGGVCVLPLSHKLSLWPPLTKRDPFAREIIAADRRRRRIKRSTILSRRYI